MSAQGVDATTIQQITDAADIGFGTFYNYVPSKEALAQEVLDCMIHNVGERNDLITQQLGEVDPVRIVANSVRFVILEITTNPVYRWWVAHLDLLVDRMRIGFGPFGLRDIDRAVGAGSTPSSTGTESSRGVSSCGCWPRAAATSSLSASPRARAQHRRGILRLTVSTLRPRTLATASRAARCASAANRLRVRDRRLTQASGVAVKVADRVDVDDSELAPAVRDMP